jgi:hypothetical protein
MNSEEAIKDLQKQIDNLVKQKNDLENEILKTKVIESEYKTKAKLYDIIYERNNLYKNKVEFAISFLNYIGENSCIYGSFVRKLFDYSLRFDKLKNINTGSFDNSDINMIYMNSNITDKTKIVSNFYNDIHYLECIQLLNIKKLSTLSTNNKENISFSYDVPLNIINIPQNILFGGYSLRSKKELNDTYDKNKKIVPHFILEFHKIICSGNQINENDKYDIIRVNIYAWRPPTVPEFSINVFYMNNTGIFKNNFSSISFTDYISNIINNEAVYIQDLNDIQNLAFPNDYCVPREVKKTFLNKIYKSISYPYLKMLENDFEIKGVIPHISIEKIEDCLITGVNPPYLKLNLECKHSISLMAYKGIINSDDDDTESIRCPMCRRDLKINFIFKDPKLVYNSNMKNIKFNMSSSENFRKKSCLISEDAINQM